MRGRSARLLFAFVLIMKNSISWQYPTAQTQRRPRDIIFPSDRTLIGTRVAGGENSKIPSGVAAIYGGSGGADGTHSLPPPPIVIPREVKPPPSRNDIILQRLAELRQANAKRTSGGRPSTPSLGQRGGSTPLVGQRGGSNPLVGQRGGSNPFLGQGGGSTPFLGQGGGSFVVNDEDLESFFRNCGDFLERCPGANRPTNTGSHVHTHNRPIQNNGFNHGHVHSPFSQHSLPGNIPVWPG